MRFMRECIQCGRYFFQTDGRVRCAKCNGVYDELVANYMDRDGATKQEAENTAAAVRAILSD